MATQIIIALCEGPHDVAFICKMLKSIYFTSNESKKLSEFPAPMGALMSQGVTKINIEELNIHQIRQNLLPLNTLQNGDNYVFLYPMGGDGKKDGRQQILSSIKGFVIEPGEAKRGRETANTNFSIAYFFDADSVGVNARLSSVNKEIKEVVPTLSIDTFTTNGQHLMAEGIKLGVYIFTSSDNNTGKLEDILIPLMKSGNDSIFNDAESYIDKHFDTSRTYPNKFSVEDNTVIEKRSTKAKDTDYDKKKSTIGITGQLQRSGKPNTAYVSDTDYLTLAKIEQDQKYQEILQFFKDFITEQS